MGCRSPCKSDLGNPGRSAPVPVLGARVRAIFVVRGEKAVVPVVLGGEQCLGSLRPKRRKDPALDKFCGRPCMGRWQIKERERQKIEKQIENLCGSVWWKPGPELLKLCREARCEILAGTSPPLKLV